MSASLQNQTLEALILTLEGELFALEAQFVREILDVVPVTEVPGAAPFLNGLINVRGKVVPLANLRMKFGMPAIDTTVDTRIIVVEIPLGGEPTAIGLIADKVHEITQIAPGALEDTPRIGMRWQPEFIRCVGKRGADFLMVLDIEAVFADGLDAEHAAAARPSLVPV